jgi:hypothetical protein
MAPLNHKEHGIINDWLVFLICDQLALSEASAESSGTSKYGAQRGLSLLSRALHLKSPLCMTN